MTVDTSVMLAIVGLPIFLIKVIGLPRLNFERRSNRTVFQNGHFPVAIRLLIVLLTLVASNKILPNSWRVYFFPLAAAGIEEGEAITAVRGYFERGVSPILPSRFFGVFDASVSLA